MSGDRPLAQNCFVAATLLLWVARSNIPQKAKQKKENSSCQAVERHQMAGTTRSMGAFFSSRRACAPFLQERMDHLRVLRFVVLGEGDPLDAPKGVEAGEHGTRVAQVGQEQL